MARVGDGERIAVHPDMARQMMGRAREFRALPTPSEQRMWAALRNRQLRDVKFRRQQGIGPFIVDFFCAEQRLIIEVDGAIHEAQREHDEERQHMLESSGYRIRRVPAHIVETDMPNILATIAEYLD